MTDRVHFAKSAERVDALGEATTISEPLCDFPRTAATRYRVTPDSEKVTCPACEEKLK